MKKPRTDSNSPAPVAGATGERERLECEKLRAEAAKLNAEADAARRPLRKTVGFYSALIPIVLALASLPFSINFFQAEAKRQEAKEALLKLDIAQFQTVREWLVKTNAQLVARQRNYEKLIAQARADARSLSNLVSHYKGQLDVAADTNKLLRPFVAELDRLEKELEYVHLTNAALLAQLYNLAENIKAGAIRITADSTIRIDEAGNIRISEPGARFTDENGKFLLDENGNFLTDDDGRTMTISNRITLPKRGNPRTN